MQLFSKAKTYIDFPEKNKIAWLGSLTLLFSYAELFIPKILPFFRLGLANIPVLAGLSLSPLSFMGLIFIKSFCTCMMSGTLFSPFFIISLLQSIGSGAAMYVLYNLNEMIKIGSKSKKLFSLYGISVLGSAVSALIQIACCYIYIGEGTVSLLGPMLLFSIFSGILTAFLLIIFEIPETAPALALEEKSETKGTESKKKKMKRTGQIVVTAVKILSLLIGAIIIFTLDSWKILLPVMIFCLILQRVSGRKVMFLPYMMLWIFIIFSSLLVPQGKVLWSFWKIRITYGALMEGIIKAMILTSVSALSQCLAGLKFAQKNSFFTLVFLYYQRLQVAYKNGEGRVFEKLKSALSTRQL